MISDSVKEYGASTHACMFDIVHCSVPQERGVRICVCLRVCYKKREDLCYKDALTGIIKLFTKKQISPSPPPPQNPFLGSAYQPCQYEQVIAVVLTKVCVRRTKQERLLNLFLPTCRQCLQVLYTKPGH